MMLADRLRSLGGTFMSLFVAFCDPATGRVEWSNAGHPPPLLRRARDGSIESLEPTGRVLGVLPDPSHSTGPELVLESGDVLLLYTDGATEARDPGGAMFSEERLRAFLARDRSKEPAALLEALRETLCEWTGTEQMDDDLTLVAARRT